MTIYYDGQEYQQFLQQYTGRGDLKIHCLQIGGTLPVAGASVTVRKIIGDDIIKIGEGVTDMSGIVEFVDLPCREAAASLQPNAVPYAGIVYEITLSHPQLGVIYDQAAIFDDVTTVCREFYQPAAAASE